MIAFHNKCAITSLIFANQLYDCFAFVQKPSSLIRTWPTATTTTTSSLSQFKLDAKRDMDISSLEEWAATNKIEVSPSVTITSKSGEDYGITLNKSSKKYESVLTVPKHLVLDSLHILREWFDYLEDSLDLISNSGFHNSGMNFVLFVKILVEHSLGESSLFHPWIASLPKSFDTSVCMDELERSCLPAYALAFADFETQQFEMFNKALDMMIESEHEDPLLTKDDVNDELKLWAFNVVTTRCWRYALDDDDDDMERPIAVPFGDMFNMREPPNVMVGDADESGVMDFFLAEDIDVPEGEDKNAELFLSYGSTNPHRSLTVFGFVDESTPEVFSQLQFNNPTPEQVNMGCNDQSKMTYRTADGGVSTAVWDCMLLPLLAQVPSEYKEFYTAHLEGDMQKKREFHQKYALEESLALKNLVEETKKELKDLLKDIDDMAANGAYDYHPRLELIRRHNAFLFKTFDMVLQRIDARANTELARRS